MDRAAAQVLPTQAQLHGRALLVLRAHNNQGLPGPLFAVQPADALLPGEACFALHNAVVELRNEHAHELKLNQNQSLALVHASVTGAPEIPEGEREKLGKRIGNHAVTFAKKMCRKLEKDRVQACSRKRKGGSGEQPLRISLELCATVGNSASASPADFPTTATPSLPSAPPSAPSRRRSVALPGASSPVCKHACEACCGRRKLLAELESRGCALCAPLREERAETAAILEAVRLQLVQAVSARDDAVRAAERAEVQGTERLSAAEIQAAWQLAALQQRLEQAHAEVHARRVAPRQADAEHKRELREMSAQSVLEQQRARRAGATTAACVRKMVALEQQLAAASAASARLQYELGETRACHAAFTVAAESRAAELDEARGAAAAAADAVRADLAAARLRERDACSKLDDSQRNLLRAELGQAEIWEANENLQQEAERLRVALDRRSRSSVADELSSLRGRAEKAEAAYKKEAKVASGLRSALKEANAELSRARRSRAEGAAAGCRNNCSAAAERKRGEIERRILVDELTSSMDMPKVTTSPSP